MDKQQAIQILAQYDHCVISTEAAQPICETFGVPVPKEIEYPDAFRADGKPVIGIAAHELAEHICSKLDIKYIHQFGRGSQLRMCCKSLTQFAADDI